MKRALVLVLALAACDEITHRVDLRLAEGNAGLQCVLDEAPNTLMAKRFYDYGVASLVVDYVELGGLAGCRSSELRNWCGEYDCRPMAEFRACIDLNFSAPDLPVFQLLEEFETQISDRLITENAPNLPLVIRAVTVAETCDDIAANDNLAFESDKLLGCVHSCPLTLGELDGEVVLDLDGLGRRCQRSVEICAATQAFRLEEDDTL